MKYFIMVGLFIFRAVDFGNYNVVYNLSSNIKSVSEIILKENRSLNTVISVGSPVSARILSEKDKKEHVVKVTLSLFIENGAESESVITNINTRISTVRDIANVVLRKKTFEELDGNNGLENLTNEILCRLREEFGTNLISNVLINDFLLQ